MKKIAAVIALLGTMLLTGGFAYGMVSVSLADGSTCGSALSGDSSGDLTDVGDGSCAAARSDRFAVALALLVAGGTGVVLGGLVGAGASNAEKADRARATA
jgi:hypothetical protein